MIVLVGYTGGHALVDTFSATILRIHRAHHTLPSHHLHVCAPQVNYKNVMKEYSLGPNGGILTSLNLFTTKFDQVR